jgi:preprotein translocase subunit YajC
MILTISALTITLFLAFCFIAWADKKRKKEQKKLNDDIQWPEQWDDLGW